MIITETSILILYLGKQSFNVIRPRMTEDKTEGSKDDKTVGFGQATEVSKDDHSDTECS